MRLDRAQHRGQQQRSPGGPSRGRRDFFSILALIPVAIYLVRSTYLLAPWVFVLSPNEPDADPHRWFYAVMAGAELFILVSFAVLMNRLRRPAMAATVAVCVLVSLAAIVPFEPDYLVVLVFTFPAILVYPYWADLRDLARGWAGAHRWLLAFAAAVGAAMLALSVVAMRKQIVNDGAVADAHLWSGYAAHLAVLALVGLIAAGVSPGALVLRFFLGAVLVYLGFVAWLALPDATGSWGVAGGPVAIAVGLAFVVSAWWDRRRRRRGFQQPPQEVEQPALPQQRRQQGDTTDLEARPMEHATS